MLRERRSGIASFAGGKDKFNESLHYIVGAEDLEKTTLTGASQFIASE